MHQASMGTLALIPQHSSRPEYPFLAAVDRVSSGLETLSLFSKIPSESAVSDQSGAQSKLSEYSEVREFSKKIFSKAWRLRPRGTAGFAELRGTRDHLLALPEAKVAARHNPHRGSGAARD